jgi:hypothetical protein
MYSEREDGGPDSSLATLYVLICRMRKPLKYYGIAIRNSHGFYRMEWA